LFIQVDICDSLRSCDTAHDQKRAFEADAVEQLRERASKREIFVNLQMTRQEMCRAAPERLNHEETRCASSRKFSTLGAIERMCRAL